MLRGTILRKGRYLRGLEELLVKYEIKEVYPLSYFDGDNSIDQHVLIYGEYSEECKDDIQDYLIKSSPSTEVWPLAIFIRGEPEEWMQPIYKDGVFYAY